MRKFAAKDRRLLISLMIVCVVTLTAAWVGEGYLRDHLLRREAERQAVTWSKFIAKNMTNLDRILLFGDSLSDGDRVRLQTAAIAGGLRQYRIYDPFGSPLVSSESDKLGSARTESFFATHIRKGKTFVRIKTRAASAGKTKPFEPTAYSTLAVTTLSDKTGSTSVSLDGGRADDPGRKGGSARQLLIGEAFVPILKGGKVIGAVGIHVDTTQAAQLIIRTSDYFKFGVTALFVVLFVMLGLFVSQNIVGRNKDLAMVTKARDKAARADEETRKVNRDLENSLKELSQAQDELVRKNRLATMGQLTATVSHELRNPLGAVRTAAYLIGRRVKDKGLGLERALDRLDNGIRRCDNIITELLDFTRTRELETEDVDFDDWTKTVVEEQALPDPVKILFDLKMPGAAVSIDPDRFRRVLINLVGNASEAMVGDGANPDFVTTPDPRILVSSRLENDRIIIMVADNGPGISRENLKKIFEPLFSTKSFGVGLGVPAVQQILETHGGGLEVASEEGKGACFTAWLPLAALKRQAA